MPEGNATARKIWRTDEVRALLGYAVNERVISCTLSLARALGGIWALPQLLPLNVIFCWKLRDPLASSGLPPPRRIALGLVPGERLGRDPRVLGQRPDRRVTGAGHQHRRPGAVLGVVGERTVPELVQRRAAGGLGEQGGGLLVAEPGPAGVVKVGGGQLDPGLPLGDEHRAGLAALQQPGQEPGRAGLPDDRCRPRRPCGGPWPAG